MHAICDHQFWNEETCVGSSLCTACLCFITKTCLYKFDLLESHFYILKLGFTGVYIIFLISVQTHRLWVLVSTEAVLTSTHSLYFEQKSKNQNFYLKIFVLLVVKFSVYLNRLVFVMICFSSLWYRRAVFGDYSSSWTTFILFVITSFEKTDLDALCFGLWLFMTCLGLFALPLDVVGGLFL